MNLDVISLDKFVRWAVMLAVPSQVLISASDLSLGQNYRRLVHPIQSQFALHQGQSRLYEFWGLGVLYQDDQLDDLRHVVLPLSDRSGTGPPSGSQRICTCLVQLLHNPF